jgi:hypothetical protein
MRLLAQFVGILLLIGFVAPSGICRLFSSSANLRMSAASSRARATMPDNSGVDAINTAAYPQVIWRTFTSFRVVKFGVSAAQRNFCSEFDSRQLHL